jgi:hypothetical protein
MMKDLMTKSKTMRMFTGLAVFGALAFGAMACEVEEEGDDPAVEEPADEPADEPMDDTEDDGLDDGGEEDDV